MKKIFETFLKIYILTIILLPVFGMAQTNDSGQYTPLSPLPCTTGSDCKTVNQTTNLSTYLPGLFKFSIYLAAFMAFVMITYGGIQYMTTDNFANKKAGKDTIEKAVWGLLLVIGAYAILYTINPQILSFNLSLPTPNIAVPKIPDGVTVAGGNNAANLDPATISALTGLTNNCNGCNITITSTTGDSHDPNSLHYQGLAADMKGDTNLNSFIRTGTQGTSAGCQTFTQNLGGKTTTFLWEPIGATCGGAVPSTGDHWHMSVTP